MKLLLRPHQLECFEHAKKQNTIVCLPTGEGKTLIAVRLIEHYLKQCPDLKVAFLVPTRPLVEQQSRYCRKHCELAQGTPPVVQTMIGDDQASWGQREWNTSFDRSHIFLGTPAVFQQAVVTDKYISVDQFSLIVFDEVHNATGNSPMAGIMRDAVAPYLSAESELPRILGLTASFIHGRLANNKIQKRQALEALMMSTIICPTIPQRLDSSNYSRVLYAQDQFHQEHEELVKRVTTESLEGTGFVKDVQKVVRKCSHVFIELGSNSLFYYIEKVIIHQIQEKATNLELQTKDERVVDFAKRLKWSIPGIRDMLDRLKQRLSLSLPPGGGQTSKLKKLLELLSQNFAGDAEYRGIIFCEQVALVSCLCKEINDALSSVRCGAVSGVQSQREGDREDQIRAFKNGDVQVLVATAALEEGIDVSECKFVVRYSNIATTKGHIQGAGRARHANAEIYYFENCPETELHKEREMVSLARNSSLGLSAEDLKKASVAASVPDLHPYPFDSTTSGSQVNVFNCKHIFVQYCSHVLGQSISPKEHLYQYNNELDVLLSIQYPTPHGWKLLEWKEYNRFWSNVDMTKIFPVDRSRNMRTTDRREMCFVYLVVLQLRENEWLDHHNKAVAAEETRLNCPLEQSDGISGISLKDTVVQSSSSQTTNGRHTSESSQACTNYENAMDDNTHFFNNARGNDMENDFFADNEQDMILQAQAQLQMNNLQYS